MEKERERRRKRKREGGRDRGFPRYSFANSNLMPAARHDKYCRWQRVREREVKRESQGYKEGQGQGEGHLVPLTV